LALLIPSDEKHRRQHGNTIADFVKIGDNAMVERIRSLLAQFPEDEAAARELIAKDASFDALCQEYRNVVDLLDGFETEIKRLKQLHASAEVTRLKHLRASLEERLLSRIEGYEPR
jgi:uncharacterized protein YdcH (DUF465 family)